MINLRRDKQGRKGYIFQPKTSSSSDFSLSQTTKEDTLQSLCCSQNMAQAIFKRHLIVPSAISAAVKLGHSTDTFSKVARLPVCL